MPDQVSRRSSSNVLSTMAKPGRNDPCPCGSGKKHKKCCLPKEEAEERKMIARYNPREPQIIMKDPTKGFTDENCMVVCRVFHDIMNDEMSLDEFDAFARRIVSGTMTSADERVIEGFRNRTAQSDEHVYWACNARVAARNNH
jgi:SEC-C motif